MRKIIPGTLYRHFKGGIYQIVTMAKDSETLRDIVVYQALYGEFTVYARPADEFLGRIDREKYPDAKETYRFEEVIRSAENSADNAVKVNTEAVSVEVRNITEKNVKECEAGINPYLEAFLEAEGFSERLEVLRRNRAHLNEEIMAAVEISLDLPVSDKDIYDRISDVEVYLMTQARFETRRLR